MKLDELPARKKQIEEYLTGKLLPFWLDRAIDKKNGGFITHFDKDGNDSGEDEKSLIAQTRTVYTFSSALRAGYGSARSGASCAEAAAHGVDFLIDKMWDKDNGGFYWTTDRKGNVAIDQKIIYGHSFAMYALAEYTLATGDGRGLEYAKKVFDLMQKYCADTMYGGYFEMFNNNWDLCGPGTAGGDRKTLDVHMHLMEAFTTLFEASGEAIHRRKLQENITNLVTRIMHPEYGTGIPQFWEDWKVAPQIKFDIVWGWDRFDDGGTKANADDNTSAGHNVEFAWLLWRALDVMEEDWHPYLPLIKKQLDHEVANGIDYEYG
ncbi:MAG: N-acylglucosamine 2-epimerase, partial [Spirochaetales bacterium]|nr:N-acylglucosamine 2-epimerase [Spirochaetales bacterium]